jgi:hypothetical protein
MSSKIRLDAMSKVISFSISDKYLEKLRSLYPSLTDNLAVKQFVTDRLDGSLGNSLDDALDDGLDDKLKTLIESSLSSSLDDTLDDVLDDKLKTIIETSLDDVLDERLDAVMGKLITSLSERMARLEKRLDDSLDGRLDDMEPLLKREKECSIATAPIPNQETVEPDSIVEPVQPAIGPVPGDSIEPGKGMTAKDAAKYLKAKKVKVSYDSLNRWINNEKIPITSPQGKNAIKHLILRGGLYYPKID